MSTLYLLFNHTLTPEQEADARKNWGVTRFEYLPDDLQFWWSNIPPEMEGVFEYLKPIRKWVDKTHYNDFILIQGDYGATYSVLLHLQCVDKATPIYSTTERRTVEVRNPDGSIEVKRVIQHCRFRKYAM